MDYWHYNFVCPFFMSDEATMIRCENKTKLCFPDKETAKDYMQRYCASHDWKEYSYARGLSLYYDRQQI